MITHNGSVRAWITAGLAIACLTIGLAYPELLHALKQSGYYGYQTGVRMYVATPLGTLGGSRSVGFGINDRGDIAGFSDTAGDVSEHAFLHSGGRMRDLGTLPGGTHSEGWSVNNRGEVSGTSEIAGGALRAFIFTRGAMRDLGTLPGGEESDGFGINDHGQVVGYSYLAGHTTADAFLYSQGSLHDLGTLGGPNSEARAINDNGEIAGTAGTADYDTHAYLYTRGRMHDLGTLPGGMRSYGFGINAAGAVTGMAEVADGQLHAFLYSRGRMRDLGSLPGFTYSVGYGVNAHEQVVGSPSFLYSGGTMYDLNALVLRGLPTGTRLDVGLAINDRGQIAAVGCGVGFCQAYRLDPVDPPPPPPARIVIDFEASPGPDGKLGTRDDIPTPSPCDLCRPLSVLGYDAMGVNFTSGQLTAGNLFPPSPGHGPNNHFSTSSVPDATFSVPVFRINLTSYSVWNLTLYAFDASGAILDADTFVNPGGPFNPNGSLNFALAQMEVSSPVPIARFTVRPEGCLPSEPGCSAIVNIDDMVFDSMPPAPM